MRKQLLQELKLISEEEKKYQSGQGNIEKQLYAKDSISEIDRELLLERGRLVTVRPHSRFVEFPEHRHNYVEMDELGDDYTEDEIRLVRIKFISEMAN